MHRSFVPPEMIAGQLVHFPASELYHLKTVLRLRDGAQIQVFDGEGREYTVELAGDCGIIVRAEERTSESPLDVTLVQGIAKGEKMDYIIQKAVELGVKTIVPLAAERVVVDLRGKEEARLTRWQRIAAEACKQCGRSVVPVVERVMTLQQAITARESVPGIFCYEGLRGEGSSLGYILKANRDLMQRKGVFLYIGPEGGFTAAEARMAEETGLFMASLGRRIMRTETASLAVLAIAQYELGDLGG